MKKSFYMVVIVLCVLCTGCSKTGGDPYDGDPTAIDQNDDVFPVITIAKPANNQVYVSGDSIIAEGKVTDNKVMYKGRVQIKNDANGFMLEENYYETHFLPVINYRVAYKAVVAVPTDFNVVLEFQDHGGNSVSAITKVKVNP